MKMGLFSKAFSIRFIFFLLREVLYAQTVDFQDNSVYTLLEMSLRKLTKLFSNTSKPSREDFTFEEWQSLSSDAKKAISKTWDPYHPEIGEATRDAILEAFKLQYPDLSKQSLAIGYSYFGWWVGCIYVIVPNSSIRVPQEFASIFVNKGYVHKRVDKKTILINWRYGGTKYEFKLPAS